MTRGARLLIAIVLGTVLSFAAATGLAIAAVYRAGSVRIDVAGADGERFRLRVPAGLTTLAIAAVPDPLLRDASRELGPYWPTIRTLNRELAELPDFTLLEVRERDGMVRVSKTGRRLAVLVDTGGDRVLVEIPLRTLERLADRLAETG